MAHEGNCSEKGGNRADTHERKTGRLGEEESKVVVADERTSDAGSREPDERESDEREKPSSWDEHEDGAERPDERGHLCRIRVLHRGQTLSRGARVVEFR